MNLLIIFCVLIAALILGYSAVAISSLLWFVLIVLLIAFVISMAVRHR